jgi:hypothetical protein
MTTVEDFNLRLSATEDVLVGLQKSQLNLVSLREVDLRTRAKALIDFLAEVDSDDAIRPEWLAEVATSAEDYLVDCLHSCMPSGDLEFKGIRPATQLEGVAKPKPWWRFWR